MKCEIKIEFEVPEDSEFWDSKPSLQEIEDAVTDALVFDDIIEMDGKIEVMVSIGK